MKICIVGGGPAGYVAALKGAIMGGEVYLIEKEDVGGVCLNKGCIPTKALISAAKYYTSSKLAGAMGVDIKDIAFDWERVKRFAKMSSKRLTSGVELLLKKRGVNVIKGIGEIKNNICVVKGDNGKELEISADKFIIATGSKPFLPNIKGIENVWGSDEALNAPKIPETLIIIGGGVIGIEFASIFNAFGSKVSIIEIMDEILLGVDREISGVLRREMEKRGVDFYLNAETKEIKKDDKGFNVIFEQEKVEKSIRGNNVLCVIGRTANLDFLPENIEVENRHLKVNEFMETSIKSIYGTGDVVGGPYLAHKAYYEGEVAIENIIKGNEKRAEEVIPTVVYSHPEISGVGKTEDELKGKNIKYTVAKFPFSANGRAISSREVVGFVKMIKGEDGKLLGLHIIGNNASEIIQEGTLSMRWNLTAENIAETIHPHPTFSEIIRESALMLEGFPIHISEE